MSGWTLGFQIVNFLVLAVLLHRLLFKPIRAMVARRREELERIASESERMRREAEELREQARREVASVGLEQSRVLAEARDQLARERDDRLTVARREAAAIVEGARRDLEIERENAIGEMTGEAVDMGLAVARRLLEQVATVGVVESFLERLCEHLDALPVDRRRALRDELDGRELLIALAPPSSSEVATRWIGLITERLGRGIDARVVADESLIAGAELRFPHTTLSFCWRDGLKMAREELLHHDDRR